jgi:hypothetical protein
MLPAWLQWPTFPAWQVQNGGPLLQLNFTSAGGVIPSTVIDTRATSKLTNLGGTVKTVGVNTASIEPNGLVIEEQHVNLLHFSQGFSTGAWLAAGSGPPAAPGITDAVATAPDGTLTASELVLPAVSAGGTYSVIYQQVIDTSGTVSLWVKGVTGGGTIYLCSTPDGAAYNRVACTYTSGAWTRFTVKSSQHNPYIEIGVDLRDGGQAAQGAQSVYIWQADYIALPYAQSAIPTTNASGTCNADVVTVANVQALPVAAGSLVMTITPEWSTPPANAYLFDSRTGSAGVGLAAYMGTDSKIRFLGPAATLCTTGALELGAGSPVTFTFAWANGNSQVFQAGTGIASGSSGTMPSSHGTLYLGATHAGASQLDGWLQSLAFYAY